MELFGNNFGQDGTSGKALNIQKSYFSGIFLQYPEDPAVLKIVHVVNLLRVVNLLPHCDLLSRRALCGHHFPGNWRLFPSPRRVQAVVNLGGVVKTLRRSNSLFLLSP